MTGLQVFQNYFLRFIYGRSIFRMISIITVLALILICISKIQLFKLENDLSTTPLNSETSKLKIQNKQINPTTLTYLTTEQTLPNLSTTTVIINIVPVKNSINSVHIYSGKDYVKINSTFNVLHDNLIKFVMNDMLIKDMNENSKKLDRSLNSKPLDYDKNARFCICSKISQPCVCCVKLAEEMIGLTKSLCANITYIPKQKTAKISMKYDKSSKPDEFVFVDIYDPPPVCLSQSMPFDLTNKQSNGEGNLPERPVKSHIVLDICFQSRNLTYNVNVGASHKTEFRGCSNFHVRLNNMTIHIYPLGCFKAGYDAKDLQIQKMANGIP